MPCFELICCVVRDGDASRALKIAKRYGIRGGVVHMGRGTVKSHLLEALGLAETRKEFVTMIVDREMAHEAIRGIGEEMEFHKDHHGIAFSIPVSLFVDSGNCLGNSCECDAAGAAEAGKNMYNAIYAIVERGRAEDVIDAAASAGARGGTILNARGAGADEVRKFFAMDIEPEKEVVFILTKSELKDAIVESIKSHLEIGEHGNSVVFVLDIGEVYGLKHD